MKTHTTQTRARGMTYFTVVISAVLIGIVLMTYLKLVSSQNQNTMRSQAWNRTVAVIEAGIEEAIAHLNHNASPDANGVFNLNLTGDGWTANVGGGWTKSNAIGDDYYIVTIGNFVPLQNNPQIVSLGFTREVPTLAGITKVAPFLADILPVTRGGYVKRAVVCQTTNVPTFTKALVAKYTIDLSGQNVRTDSFDSANDLYSTNHRYDVNKRRDNGDIASNVGVTNSQSPLNIGNANIYGHVSTGPNLLNPGVGLIAVGSQGKVGDIAWQNDPSTGGQIKPGWSKDDMNMEFPDVVLPYSAASPPGTTDPITGQKFVGPDGVTYDMLLNGGDYILNNNQTLSGKIYVKGNSRLVVPNSGKIALSGASDMITIAPGASLKVYADCPYASIGGNGVQNPGIATNFYYFGTPRNTSLSYGGNAAFTGVFYAPNAAMTLGGGGNAQIDFSGAAVVSSVKMNGNFTFHYDENLKRIGLFRGYVLTSWDEQ